MMLDLKLIREKPEEVAKRLATRGGGASLDELLTADATRRRCVAQADELKALRNRVSDQIAQAKRARQDPAAQITEMRRVGDRIKGLDQQIRDAEGRIQQILLRLPNLPHPTVPVGALPDDNQEVRRWGEPSQFAFEARPHWEIGEALGILDLDRAAKLATSRFAVLYGAGARLERALINFMLDLHTREHGYREVWTPYLVNADTMEGTGQLPKFEAELFKMVEPEQERVLYLIPTAEVPVTNLHRGEILMEAELPKRYVASTPCFRREAGSYGADTRGLIRQHQFDKVELVWITAPEVSYEALERLTADAEAVLQRLELPYRVVTLCTGDMGFSAAKTYDIEVWLPAQGRYREISSCSNCEAFQARRMGLRFRRAGGGRAEHCHTLNGSGLAVGRTMIALLENYQQADGAVLIPKALQPYMDGAQRLEPLR